MKYFKYFFILLLLSAFLVIGGTSTRGEEQQSPDNSQNTVTANVSTDDANAGDVQLGDVNEVADQNSQAGTAPNTTYSENYCPTDSSYLDDPNCIDYNEPMIYNDYSYPGYSDYSYPRYSYSLPYYPQFYGSYPTYYGGYYNNWVDSYPWWDNYPGYVYTSPTYYNFGGVYLPYFWNGNFRYWSNWYPFHRHFPFWRGYRWNWFDHHREYWGNRMAFNDRFGRRNWNMIRDGSITRSEGFRRGRNLAVTPNRSFQTRRDAGTATIQRFGQNRSIWRGSQRYNTGTYRGPGVYRNTWRNRVYSPGFRYRNDMNIQRQRIYQGLNPNSTNRQRRALQPWSPRRNAPSVFENRTRIMNRPGTYFRQQTIRRDGSTMQGTFSNRRPFFSPYRSGYSSRGPGFRTNRGGSTRIYGGIRSYGRHNTGLGRGGYSGYGRGMGHNWNRGHSGRRR